MSLFNKVAHRYDAIVGPFSLDKIIEHLPLNANGLLLDLGGGTGRVAEKLVNLVNECFVLDLSYEMLNQAKNKSNGFSLIQATSAQVPFRTKSLNQIFLNDSLHHIREQQETINECYRLLKPNGQLIIREFDKSNFINIFLRIGEALLMFRSKFLSPKELASMCEQAGFKTSWIKPDKRTFILIAKKE
jgi:demethylmenaquinone methyltransferase/2-methoxy-6-polyprenyl-1,4-benzoquinol methylase